MLKPKIAQKLKNKLLAAKKEMDDFVEENFVGRIVVWDEGLYAGRQARIRVAKWDWSWDDDEDICVDVLVETKRLDGKGYLDNNDNYHRRYLSVYSYFREQTSSKEIR